MAASQTSMANNFYVASHWKIESQKIVCLWWCIIVLCISQTSAKVLPKVVKFYQEIFYKIWFSNTSRRVLLKLPRNNQLFLIQSQVAEHHCIPYIIFQTFHACYYCLQSSFSQSSSVLIFSVLFSPHFCRDEVKMFFDIP